MKKIVTYCVFVIMSIAIHGQEACTDACNTGIRVPSFKDKDFKYLQSIAYKTEYSIDTILLSNCEEISDTFKNIIEYRELTFNLPEKLFIYKEILKKGMTINSKKYGEWYVCRYDFYDTLSNYANRCCHSDFYFNDKRILNVYLTVNKKINYDYRENNFIIEFQYLKKDTSTNLCLKCIENDSIICSLSNTNHDEIFCVDSKYLDEEMILLLQGFYDRKIFTHANSVYKPLLAAGLRGSALLVRPW